jgi:hypothetical protein
MGAGCLYPLQPVGQQPQQQHYFVQGAQVVLDPRSNQQQPQQYQQQQQPQQYQQQLQPQYQQQQQQSHQYQQDPQYQQNAQYQNQLRFHEATVDGGGGYWVDGKWYYGSNRMAKNIFQQHQKQANQQSQIDQQTKGYQTTGDSIFKPIKWGVMR